MSSDSPRAGVLAGILLVALATRLWQIDQPLVDAFSWRQASTAMMAEHFYAAEYNPLFPAVRWVGAEPGYQGREFQTATLIAAAIYHLVGVQDWVGRSVSVAMGVWGVAALYLLIRRVWDEPRALAAAAVLAVMPGAIFVDRSFLPDPTMVALATTGLWLWIEYFHRNTIGWLIAACLVWTLGVLTKLPGLITLLPLLYAAFALPAPAGRRRRAVVLVAALAGCLAVLASYYAWAVYVGKNYPPYHVAGEGNLLWEQGIAAWAAEAWYLPGIADHLLRWMWAWPLAALFVVGLVVPPAKTDRPGRWLAHCWLAGGVVLIFVGAREVRFNPWNLHVLNPPAAAIAGWGLLVLTRLAGGAVEKIRPQAEIVPAVRGIVAVGLLALVAWQGWTHVSRMYWPAAQKTYRMGLALERASSPGETVVTIAHNVGDPIGIYYSRRNGWVFPVGGNGRVWSRFVPDGPEAIAEFESLRDAGADWLGIAGNPVDQLGRDFWNHHPQLFAHIERTCDTLEWGDGYVIYRILPSTRVDDESRQSR